jgi:succinate-semialdehyde dehydrogenase
VIRCAAPAVMAGNAVVLKHASNVPGCALAIAEAFDQAGLPPGTFATLLVPSSRAGELVTDPRIAAVSVTGSEPAGAAVAAAAGRSLKKTVLELGGSDAFIVLADADPERTAAEAAAARCINNGESCIAAKRFIVDAAIADDFTHHLKSAMAAMTIGDPLDRATQIGPLARPDLVDALEDQVTRSVQLGARVVTGGRRLERPGCFFPPTVLADVVPGMPAFDEETFGPVAPVIRARDTAHAVELANRSRFGLGASIWTADPAHGEALAARIEAGSVFINGAVKSDPRLPFGGVKASGYGRELSAEGIREFTNVKTVWRR